MRHAVNEHDPQAEDYVKELRYQTAPLEALVKNVDGTSRIIFAVVIITTIFVVFD